MVSVTTVSLFLFSLFLMLTSAVLRLARLTSERMEVYAYLADGADPELLKSQVSRVAGVKEVRYVSKDKALKEFQTDLGEEAYLLDLLGYNPLPPSLRLELEPSYRNPKQLFELSEKLYLLPGVEEVWYGKEVIGRLYRNLRLLVGVDLLMLMFVGFVVGFVVLQTIEMEALVRSTQTEIMSLVGATPKMIKAPFRFEGLIQGLIGGFLAFLLSALVGWAVHREFPGFQFNLWVLLLINLALGGVIGVWGADRALDRMLKR
jgi:cell division transport system permease protein